MIWMYPGSSIKIEEECNFSYGMVLFFLGGVATATVQYGQPVASVLVSPSSKESVHRWKRASASQSHQMEARNESNHIMFLIVLAS